MSPRVAIVPAGMAGERIDRALAGLLEISRGEARRALAAGRVMLDRQTCKVASRKVNPGAQLTLLEEPLTWTAPEPAVVHLDREVLVVDKPPGVAVQPGRDPQSLPDLLRWWRGREPRETLRVVHRLDVPASGLVILARTRPAAARLSAAFADRSARRTYRARTHPPAGEPGATVEIELPLLRDKGTAIVDEARGKPARTTGEVGRDGDIELTMHTGRYHQLRAHLAAIGCPIIGDRRYRGPDADRLYLHAEVLTVPLAEGPRTFRAPAPWL